MSLLITYKDRLDDPSLPWLEDHLQMAVAQQLHRIEEQFGDRFTFAADMTGLAASSKLVAGRAKLMGMRSGETDLRLYFDQARLVSIEMKLTGGKGLSDAQIERHALLRRMGFRVETVFAACPAEAVEQVAIFVGEYLPLHEANTSVP